MDRKSDQFKTLIIELKETGERLTIRRVRNKEGSEELLISGILPAHQEGPPLHIHHFEYEYISVLSGTASAQINGKKYSVESGGSLKFLKGSKHRWWNEGDKRLILEGTVSPAGDLDCFLDALFEVLNMNPGGRPVVFYIAHVLHRHRKTQSVLVFPRILQRILFPIVIILGKLFGKYKGTDWPGCPDRCTGTRIPESNISIH